MDEQAHQKVLADLEITDTQKPSKASEFKGLGLRMCHQAVLQSDVAAIR